MITLLAACMLVLGLLPAALYVLVRIKSPLNPSIYHFPSGQARFSRMAPGPAEAQRVPSA